VLVDEFGLDPIVVGNLSVRDEVLSGAEQASHVHEKGCAFIEPTAYDTARKNLRSHSHYYWQRRIFPCAAPARALRVWRAIRRRAPTPRSGFGADPIDDRDAS
jgi:hypothetical protein